MPRVPDFICAEYHYDPALDAAALDKIVSIKRDPRGDKLVVLAEELVVVARNGPNPLAWARLHTPRRREKRAPGAGWKPVRPAIDGLLMSPGRWRAMMDHATALAKDARARDGRPARADDLPDPAGKDPAGRIATDRLLQRYLRANGLPRGYPVRDAAGEFTPLARRVAADYWRRIQEWNTSPAARAESHRDYRWRVLRQSLRVNHRGRLLGQWLSGFPPAALDFLDRCGFARRRWHVLNLWLRVPGGRDLFEDFPQLAWMLASSWNFRAHPVKRPFRSLRTLVRQPRAAVLGWLGLPGGSGVQRLLRRMPCHELSGPNAVRLREVLRQPQSRQWLQNLPGPLDPHLLGLLAFRRPVSFPILLAMAEETSDLWDIAGTGLTVRETHAEILRMLAGFDHPAARARLAAIRSPVRLRELHDELARVIGTRAERALARDWAGPIEPPVRPAPWMQPLRTYSELCQEGMEMNHCVATLARDILGGRLYIYAIRHAVDRATLAVARNHPSTPWRLHELRGPGNRPVHPAVIADLQAWLHREQPPIATPGRRAEPVG